MLPAHKTELTEEIRGASRDSLCYISLWASWSPAWPFQSGPPGLRCTSSSHQAWRRPSCPSLRDDERREINQTYETAEEKASDHSKRYSLMSAPSSSSFLFLALGCRTDSLERLQQRASWKRNSETHPFESVMEVWEQDGVRYRQVNLWVNVLQLWDVYAWILKG